MNGTKKDIDPATELVEEDEEQSPARGRARDRDRSRRSAGPLAAGRAAIARYAKLAPNSPGVYRMIDANGEVLYVGKAKSISKRIVAYARPTGYDTPHRAHDRGDRRDRIRLDRDRDRGAAARSQPDQAAAPALQRAAARRQVVSLHPDHRRSLGAADPQASRRAHRGQGSYYGPFASVWAVNRTITALQRAFLLRSCSDAFFESRTRPCLLHQIKRCSAPCTGEIDFADYAELVREAKAFLSGKSRAVKEELAGEMEKASAALDFERAAVYRDRLAALSAVQAHQGINPRSVEEADVFAVHQEGGFFCVEVFFFRTGQNWGNRAYFPRADRSLGPGEVLGAFLAQFYDDKPPPRCIFLSHEIEDRALLAEALARQERPQGRGRAAAARREEGAGRSRARQCARGARAQARRDAPRSASCSTALAECFGLPRAPRRIEVYDNSHIQGSERGRRHDRRRGRRVSGRTSTASSTSGRPISRPATTSA